jgi:hypothetical protein
MVEMFHEKLIEVCIVHSNINIAGAKQKCNKTSETTVTTNKDSDGVKIG